MIITTLSLLPQNKKVIQNSMERERKKSAHTQSHQSIEMNEWIIYDLFDDLFSRNCSQTVLWSWKRSFSWWRWTNSILDIFEMNKSRMWSFDHYALIVRTQEDNSYANDKMSLIQRTKSKLKTRNNQSPDKI